MNKKFTAILIEEDDSVRMGMVGAVAHMVAYGKVDETFVKELNSKRPAKEGVISCIRQEADLRRVLGCLRLREFWESIKILLNWLGGCYEKIFDFFTEFRGFEVSGHPRYFKIKIGWGKLFRRLGQL